MSIIRIFKEKQEKEENTTQKKQRERLDAYELQNILEKKLMQFCASFSLEPS